MPNHKCVHTHYIILADCSESKQNKNPGGAGTIGLAIKCTFLQSPGVLGVRHIDANTFPLIKLNTKTKLTKTQKHKQLFNFDKR